MVIACCILLFVCGLCAGFIFILCLNSVWRRMEEMGGRYERMIRLYQELSRARGSSEYPRIVREIDVDPEPIRLQLPFMDRFVDEMVNQIKGMQDPILFHGIPGGSVIPELLEELCKVAGRPDLSGRIEIRYTSAMEPLALCFVERNALIRMLPPPPNV